MDPLELIRASLLTSRTIFAALQNAVLLLHIVSKTRFGGEDSLGISTEVRVVDLLDKKGGGQDGKTKWYDLSGKRLMPGKVLMDLDARIAEPEHDISVFLGTWNVGNTRPLRLWICHRGLLQRASILNCSTSSWYMSISFEDSKSAVSPPFLC
ncbi:hypothetical protein SELMODRAFT_419095 [Selaginella moellendorffii]|uniref:Inositol polyphosphate-related phosphatase domain-containing protein n=1 Tax=Selaginella moellendorffii TaxID=88036 RepID=D8S7U1_SELML|nr:hypothetical protein SELMODRAFT_419095 [Selaginella moellendorffii]